MADAYLDHGAYASNLGAVPTWGVPQEGDGSATTPAAASSIASVAFASVPTSGTISVCGITISTTGVIGAASADAAANTLATNINATTTAVAAGVARGTPQLRNLVFARGPSGGAPSGTCQVMMRVGSDGLNYATNSNAQIATTFSAAPTITQFVGGSGGCWGVLFNTAAIGVSNSIGAATYGLLNSTPMAAYPGFVFDAYDTVQVRTGRNLSLSYGAGITAQTSRPTYVNLLFDDGTIWSGDSPTAKLTLELPSLQNAFHIGFVADSKFGQFKAKRLGGFTIGMTFIGSGNLYLDYANAAFGCHYEKVAFIERAGVASNFSPLFFNPSATGRHSKAFVDCLLDFSATARANLVNPLFDIRSGSLTLLGNEFRWNLTGVGGAATTVALVQSAFANSHTLTMRGNRASIGQPYDLRAYSNTGTGGVPGGSLITLENNKGLGMPAGAVGATVSTPSVNNVAVVFDNLGVGGSAKYEDRRGYCEFNVGQPVLSAAAPDGTNWSWLVYWTSALGVIDDGMPFSTPAARIQSRLATAARNWSIELLVDSVALANLPLYAFVELQYVNGDGDPVHERVPMTLAASAVSWSNVAAAPYNTWVARKVSGTTSETVKQDSIVNVRIVMTRSTPGGSTATFAIDPEPALS